MAQAQLAVALKNFKRIDVAKKIVASLKERSLTSEEMGMYWDDGTPSYWWYRAPIETQAMMIEMFSEVTNDEKSVEECKVWLIKQKQTQNWKTTKATADAVYSLLLRGENLLTSDRLVSVSVGGIKIEPEKVEAGTGFYEKVFHGGEIKPEFGKIELEKEDKGVAWGSVHWKYLEDMSKITPHKTNLSLTKRIFVEKNSKKGPIITEVKDGKVRVGDLLVIRIVLRSDRDMEYVHMKDMRGSGLEPVDVLSGYRYQDGLSYYQTTRDSATHFS
jgi:hypothetical protein